MNTDDVDFPALSAHVQDGRRGKVSAIAKPGNPAPHESYRLPLEALPSLHQDVIPDYQNPLLHSPGDPVL
ncbi:hypothetical protein VZT92_015313 [Zoarces viviparus]|uniref:Uncharacterized protein n=1 Tax=Zoarces viviparus TaxID=48416 RepID=A0AAW1EWP5_ZOAVI